MKFDVSQMRSWPSTKPWNLSVEDAQYQRVDGWGYSSRLHATEVASWEKGMIVAHPEFFTLPEEARRGIAYHEAGHAMLDAFGLGNVRSKLNIDPMDLIDLPGAQGLGYNADEIVAEAYSALWCDLGWFDRMHADEIRRIVVAIAQGAGWPLPSGARTASSPLYWRTHPADRPFSVEDATSTNFNGPKVTLRGYSCFADPWYLWLYLDANRMYAAAEGNPIIGFSGERVGTGNDGEDLVVPDMKVVRRMTLAQFEHDVLLSTPLPSSPQFAPGWSGFSSWRAVKGRFGEEFKVGDDPVIDMILKHAISWRGLMSGPVWTDYPACIIVDPGGMGRQSYEVYIGGEPRPRQQRLQDAKDYIEAQIGPCTFQRVKPELQKADHYFLGPTTEFTDPVTVYAAIPV